MYLDLVWFDSFGAKSSCIFVETDQKIIVDPGVSIMHPSFPASENLKIEWRNQGYQEILSYLARANIVIITHYHWDHFIHDRFDVYKGKHLFVKNPNEWINDSQRERALEFFKNLFNSLNLKFKLLEPLEKKYEIPKLESFEKDFGDYNSRRRELLRKGEEWFWKRVEKWNNYPRIPEANNIIFAEGKEVKIEKTKIKFSEPRFHGIEFSRVGWVYSVIIEFKNKKIYYSSDLNGPIIEDYAYDIVKAKPDIIILDGPPTYLIPYQMNLINLKRVIENLKYIIENLDFELLIWDHHLPREKNFRKRTKEVWDLAKKLKKRVLTASEFKFKKLPVIEEIR